MQTPANIPGDPNHRHVSWPGKRGSSQPCCRQILRLWATSFAHLTSTACHANISQRHCRPLHVTALLSIQKHDHVSNDLRDGMLGIFFHLYYPKDQVRQASPVLMLLLSTLFGSCIFATSHRHDQWHLDLRGVIPLLRGIILAARIYPFSHACLVLRRCIQVDLSVMHAQVTLC